ncbi:MAG: ABC transporter substrate-binding protein [Bdellovibrionales bacterium]|nr:ABC transporter substrate-binding protein [Bdellovibrionales bacterium]
MSIPSRILLSRFLTRFGDQAWDFAIPLVLISIFPGQLQNVAGYYLISKIAQFFLNPIIIRWIDHLPRKQIYRLGIGSQTFAVALTWLLIEQFYGLLGSAKGTPFWIIYMSLGLIGIIGSLGSTLMEISVGYDLAADMVPKNDLAIFNSRMKRIDLFTEVTAPIFAGAVMLLPSTYFFNIGFTIVAILNVCTFLPEYLLLSSIKGLVDFTKPKGQPLYVNPFQEFKAGIADFKDLNFMVPMMAYSFLWLSVLSPHGVLLSGFLKDGSQLSEFQISIFRGFGAFVGMIPTFLYPIVHKKMGLINTSKIFLGFQAICVLLAALFFESNLTGSIYIFLSLVLLSRIGLYGFSIGESEARQLYIPAASRGRINGVGVSLTSFATLILFGTGTILPTSNDFSILVWISSISVLIGFLILLKWQPKA